MLDLSAMSHHTVTSRRRAIFAPLAIAGVVLLILEVARRLFRASRMFAPSREPVAGWDPQSYGIAAGSVEPLWFETADGEVLYGWYCRTTAPIGSALYLHGNSGNLTTTATVIPHLLDSGLNVLTLDYRGFGRSSGHPSMSGIVRDAVDAARLHDRLRPAGLPSILYGFSMGGAVGAQLLRRHSFDGMIFQSTFTNLRDIARATYPRFPLHLLSGGLFDSSAIVSRLQIPALFLHGDHDEVCPSWMSQTLHDLCASPSRQLAVVEGGQHNDLYDREPARLKTTIRTFVSAITPRATPIEIRTSALERFTDWTFRSIRRLMRRRSEQNGVVRSAAFKGWLPPHFPDHSPFD